MMMMMMMIMIMMMIVHCTLNSRLVTPAPSGGWCQRRGSHTQAMRREMSYCQVASEVLRTVEAKYSHKQFELDDLIQIIHDSNLTLPSSALYMYLVNPTLSL